MEELLNSIEKVIKACYLNREEDAKCALNDVIEKIINIEGMYDALLPLLSQVNSALEVRDYISVADYFNYGIKQILKDKDIPDSLLYSYSNLLPDTKDDIFYLEAFLEEELTLCIKNNNKIEKINSLFSPSNEAQFLFNEHKIKKNTPTVCLFGIGTGVLAEKILSCISLDSKLFIYEPSKTIIDYIVRCGNEPECSLLEKKVLNRIKKVLEDKRVIMYYENDMSRSFYMFLAERVTYSGLVGLIPLVHNGYKTIYAQSCLSFYKQLNDFRQEVFTNRNTEAFFKDEYVNNAFKNLRFCKKMNLCSELTDIVPKNIPTIIVSAGPSLDKNIEDLRMAKGHSLIVAVDTAVKNLLKKNIIPDITVTADPYKPADYYSDVRVNSIPCVYTNNANSQILDKLTGRMFLIDGRKEYIEMLLNTMNIKTTAEQGFGGSVATTAFAVLVSINVKNIILVGQDLAYSGEFSHAGETDDGSKAERVYVEGITGDKVLSRSDWFNYLKWFEDAIGYLNHEKTGVKVIDATEGGAKIHGTDIMTLKEALDSFKDKDGNLPEYDFNEKISTMPKLFDEDGYKKLCDKHKDEIRKIRNIKNDAYEITRICEQMIKDIKNGSASDRYIIKQNKIIKDIREKLEKSPMYFVINRYAQNFVADEMVKLELKEGSIKSMQMNLTEEIKIAFESVINCCDKVAEIAKQYEVDL